MSLFAILFTFDTDDPDKSIAVFASVQASAPINPLLLKTVPSLQLPAKPSPSYPHSLRICRIRHLFSLLHTWRSARHINIEMFRRIRAQTRSRSIVKRWTVQPSHSRFTCAHVDVASGSKRDWRNRAPLPCDDDMVRCFFNQIESSHESDSETHRGRDKPDTQATKNWLETNNYN